ncbi:MAG: tetratricopeptide repeat protein [Candidatus Neomarinimicrobiota bacterium]
MNKTVSIDVKSLVPFPKIEISLNDLTKNLIVQNYVEVMTEISDLNIISSKIALNKLIQLENVEDQELKGIVLAGIGGIHTFVGNYLKAFAAFKTSFDLVSGDESIALLYSELSNLLRKLGYKNEAIAILNEALRLTKNNGLYWKLTTQLALSYKFSNPDLAIEIINRCLSYYKEKYNYIRIARLFRHLGTTYLAKNDFGLARKYYDQAIELSERHKLDLYKYDVLNDRGWLFVMESDFINAKLIYTDILSHELSPYQEGLALQNLGYLEFEQGEYQEAIRYHSQSLQLTTRYEMRDMAFEDYYKLGLCHDKIGEKALADKYYATGYKDLQQEIDLGLRILGYRKKLLNSYISFLDRNKSIVEIDLNAEIFRFTMDKSLKDIRDIFHTNLLKLHLDRSKNAPDMCQKLKIEPRTYFTHQKKLGLKRGPGIPKQIENNPYFQRYLDSIAVLDWRSANKKFDSDLFDFLLNKYQHNKRKLADDLDISYQQVLMKTKGLD